MVDALGRVLHIGPVGEILGQPLPARVGQGHVHHLAPPLGVGQQQLLEGQHAAHDVLGRLQAVRAHDHAPPAHLGPQGLEGGGASGRGRLRLEDVGLGPERGHEGGRARPARPPRSRSESRPPTCGSGSRRRRSPPCRRAARPARRRAARRGWPDRRRGCARSARRAGRAGARPASGPAARSGSPAPARCRRGRPGPPRRRPWPGCRPGSRPRPGASAGRSGAAAAGPTCGGGSTRGSSWPRRRRPCGRCRRRRSPGPGRARPRACGPWATASRSAAPIVMEAHVVPLPARIRCREEASPPPAGTRDQLAVGPGAEGQRAAVGDDDGGAHLDALRTGGATWWARPARARPAARRPPGGAALRAAGCGGCAHRGPPGPGGPLRATGPRR